MDDFVSVNEALAFSSCTTSHPPAKTDAPKVSVSAAHDVKRPHTKVLNMKGKPRFPTCSYVSDVFSATFGISKADSLKTYIGLQSTIYVLVVLLCMGLTIGYCKHPVIMSFILVSLILCAVGGVGMIVRGNNMLHQKQTSGVPPKDETVAEAVAADAEELVTDKKFGEFMITGSVGLGIVGVTTIAAIVDLVLSGMDKETIIFTKMLEEAKKFYQ